MSSDINPTGSGDEPVTFEELPDLNIGENQNPAGGSSATPIQAAGQGGDGYGKGKSKYPASKSKTYKCPPGYGWDPAKKACVKVVKEIQGPETCDLVEVVEEIAKPPEGAEGQAEFAKKGPYSCPAGEVWDDKKGKCIPVKEALSEKDSMIGNLTKRLEEVEKDLRMKKIEETVDEQIRAGKIAPVQRTEVVNFMTTLPQEGNEALLGIFSHQKFPLKEETGAQESKPAGSSAAGKIGESDSAIGLSAEDKAKLKKKFGIDILIEERGVKRAS